MLSTRLTTCTLFDQLVTHMLGYFRSALSSIGEGVTLPTCVSPVGYDTVSGHRVWAGAMASLPGNVYT